MFAPCRSSMEKMTNPSGPGWCMWSPRLSSIDRTQCNRVVQRAKGELVQTCHRPNVSVGCLGPPKTGHGVLLTRLLYDGANGLAMVQGCGGQAIVQDPSAATASQMPAAALHKITPDHVVPLQKIAATIGLCLGGVEEEIAS